MRLSEQATTGPEVIDGTFIDQAALSPAALPRRTEAEVANETAANEVDAA
jgi:hypothetical protein